MESNFKEKTEASASCEDHRVFFMLSPVQVGFVSRLRVEKTKISRRIQPTSSNQAWRTNGGPLPVSLIKQDSTFPIPAQIPEVQYNRINDAPTTAAAPGPLKPRRRKRTFADTCKNNQNQGPQHGQVMIKASRMSNAVRHDVPAGVGGQLAPTVKSRRTRRPAGRICWSHGPHYRNQNGVPARVIAFVMAPPHCQHGSHSSGVTHPLASSPSPPPPPKPPFPPPNPPVS